MVAFTRDEIEFLKRHKLTPGDFLDDLNAKRSNWKQLAAAGGKDFAVRNSCTKKLGHRLVSRSGHCIQCDASRIAFVRRDRSPGFVYISISPAKKILKIGSSSDVERRRKQATSEEYGGARDWQELYFVEVKEAGRLEFEVHRLLAQYQIRRDYIKNGKTQEARELFDCSFKTALTALLESLTNMNFQIISDWTFPNWRQFDR